MMATELTENQQLAKEFLRHQNHFNGPRDPECRWCLYAAELDRDTSFLSKIPKGRLKEILAPIKRIRKEA